MKKITGIFSVIVAALSINTWTVNVTSRDNMETTSNQNKLETDELLMNNLLQKITPSFSNQNPDLTAFRFVGAKDGQEDTIA